MLGLAVASLRPNGPHLDSAVLPATTAAWHGKFNEWQCYGQMPPTKNVQQPFGEMEDCFHSCNWRIVERESDNWYRKSNDQKGALEAAALEHDSRRRGELRMLVASVWHSSQHFV